MTFRDHHPDMPTLLALIRERPGLYLGRITIRGLHLYLSGIEFAQDFHAIQPDFRFGGFDLMAFEAWVAANHNPKGWTYHSFGLAAHLAGSDEEGLPLWFRWYDDFRADPSSREVLD